MNLMNGTIENTGSIIPTKADSESVAGWQNVVQDSEPLFIIQEVEPSLKLRQLQNICSDLLIRLHDEPQQKDWLEYCQAFGKYLINQNHLEVVDFCKSGWLSNTVKLLGQQQPSNLAVWTKVSPTETSEVTGPTTIAGLVVMQDVIDFAETKGVLDCLRFSIENVKAAFGSDTQMEVGHDRDQEIEGEWLTITVHAKGEVQKIFEKYNRLTESWVKHVPWPEREMIRHSIIPV